MYYIYILASRRNGTLYIGVTNNLEKRTSEHVTHFNEKSFTAKYGVGILVYYECTDSIDAAIRREKQLKGWNRKWKLKLIEDANPTWKSLISG